MVVEVHDEHTAFESLASQHANGDGDVGQRAEPLRFIGLCVMESSSEIEPRLPVAQSRSERGQCATCRVPERHQQTMIPRVARIEEQIASEGVGIADRREILGRVHQKEILVRDRRRRLEISSSGGAASDQRVTYAPRSFDVVRVAPARFDDIVDVVVAVEQAT